MHSRVPNNNTHGAVQAAEKGTAGQAVLPRQLFSAEEPQHDVLLVDDSCPEPERKAADAIRVSTVAAMTSTTNSHSGVTHHQSKGETEHKQHRYSGTGTGAKDVEEEDEEEEADTPEVQKHGDIVDEERRQLEKLEDQKRIAVCPRSWKCSKCLVLNSHRSRSCDSCFQKKPPLVLVPRVKFPGPGRPRDESKIKKDMSQPSVKKSHKKKIFPLISAEHFPMASKAEPVQGHNVVAERVLITKDGADAQPIKKSHKKKVVVSIPAVSAAAPVSSQLEVGDIASATLDAMASMRVE